MQAVAQFVQVFSDPVCTNLNGILCLARDHEFLLVLDASRDRVRDYVGFTGSWWALEHQQAMAGCRPRRASQCEEVVLFGIERWKFLDPSPLGRRECGNFDRLVVVRQKYWLEPIRDFEWKVQHPLYPLLD